MAGKEKNGFPYDFSGQRQRSNFRVKAASSESLSYERFISSSDDGGGGGGGGTFISPGSGFESSQSGTKAFRNRFLNFAKLGSVLNNAAESFFKSEIRRRLFITAVLLVISRVGYFIPLPGFDRRLIPENYLSFVSGSVGKPCCDKVFNLKKEGEIPLSIVVLILHVCLQMN